jgi:hypothetical protein
LLRDDAAFRPAMVIEAPGRLRRNPRIRPAMMHFLADGADSALRIHPFHRKIAYAAGGTK